MLITVINNKCLLGTSCCSECFLGISLLILTMVIFMIKYYYPFRDKVTEAQRG